MSQELCPTGRRITALPFLGTSAKCRNTGHALILGGVISQYQNTILEAAFRQASLVFFGTLHWKLNKSLPTSYLITILVIWVGARERWVIS
jgi:hypothetical protein